MAEKPKDTGCRVQRPKPELPNDKDSAAIMGKIFTDLFKQGMQEKIPPVKAPNTKRPVPKLKKPDCVS